MNTHLADYLGIQLGIFLCLFWLQVINTYDSGQLVNTGLAGWYAWISLILAVSSVSSALVSLDDVLGIIPVYWGPS